MQPHLLLFSASHGVDSNVEGHSLTRRASKLALRFCDAIF